MSIDLSMVCDDGCAVMGIVNATPDSFSGDGVYSAREAVEQAVSQARRFLEAGVAVLDIGGESTRPGAEPLDAETERARVIPVIQAIKHDWPDAVLSIDTYKASVAAAALDAGAAIINDVWGGQADPAILRLAAERTVPLILMHNRATWGATRQDDRLGGAYNSPDTQNLDTSAFIDACLAETSFCVDAALAAGVSHAQLIVDPGIGFGKTVDQNLALISASERFRTLAPRILIGPSRKNFIGKILDAPVEERLFGTAATAAIAAFTGADLVRVHDAQQMVDVVTLANNLKRMSC